MFREIVEIKKDEIKKVVKEEKSIKIKPKTDITVEEAKKILDSLFA